MPAPRDRRVLDIRAFDIRPLDIRPLDIRPLDIRPPTLDEWPAVCQADARAFGVSCPPEEVADRLKMHNLERFRVAFDGGRIVAIAGSYSMDVALPGGAIVPMGGVTWVSTAATHRRQGLMRRVVGAVHEDIDARGEPVATLYAAEGGIYEHLDYGIATRVRVTSLDTRLTRIRDEYRSAPGAVRFLEGDEVVPTVTAIWNRFRTLRAGETGRSAAVQSYLYDQRLKPSGPLSPVVYLGHADGYAAFRTEERWNDGHPAHTLHLIELAALTPEAHAALWQTLLGIDLVGEIRSRAVPIDDPLPFLLENQRALRTTDLNDGVWVNVRDVAACFGARTYRTTDRIVVEVDGRRWAVDGGPDGASCTPVRSRPDLVTSHAWFSSLLYGGVVPSALVAGRRMTARNDAVLARADLFFPTSLAPHCQDQY
jgi:predicted acetyltransferase